MKGDPVFHLYRVSGCAWVCFQNPRCGCVLVGSDLVLLVSGSLGLFWEGFGNFCADFGGSLVGLWVFMIGFGGSRVKSGCYLLSLVGSWIVSDLYLVGSWVLYQGPTSSQDPTEPTLKLSKSTKSLTWASQDPTSLEETILNPSKNISKTIQNQTLH